MPGSPLISPDELHGLLEAGSVVRLLDVRYRLDRPDGRDDYRAAHLPGAVYVDMDTELATHGAPSEGRHPLPSHKTLQDAARRWGLNDGDAVVVYDDYRSVAAARAWWMLRGAGVVDVRVLDGGLSAWRAAGLPLETGDVEADPGSVVLDDLTGASRSTRPPSGRSAEYCSTHGRPNATAATPSRTIPSPGTSRER